MEQNEKVVAITATSDSVYGLTETGCLVFYDRDANAWALRCKSEVLGVDRVNALKWTPPPANAPGRYRNPSETTVIKKKVSMIDFVMIGAGLVALAGLLYFFIR